MGTVGINFGSATSGAGFDVTTTVASIVANLKAVENPWNTQLTKLKAQDTAFSSIGTDLGALSTSLQALTDFQGVMASKQGSSSDTNVLALSSAGPTATAGSHTIVVSQLAQTSSQYSDPIPASDVLSGGLTIQVGSGAAIPVNIVSGTSDTLAAYAAAINLADVGVKASIITDSSGSRLSLVSQTSGASGDLTITGSIADTTAGSSPIAINTGLDGKDALLTVDGIHVDSSSNIVSTAIPGVSFQLLQAAPATQVQVQIVNDNSSVETAFSNFVSSYNKVVGDIKTQEGNDSSGNAEPLFGNPVIAQLQSSLALALTTGAGSGSINSLNQLGISSNNDGTLTLNGSALDSVLNSNYQDVVGYLQNSNSFGLTFQNSLDQLGNQSPIGAITLALNSNAIQETTFNQNITNQDALIAAQQITLTNQLNAANQILQAIPQQLNNVDELYNALTGYNANSQGKKIMETAYQQQALRSANGVELVIALYDGAIRFLYRAIQCVEAGDEIGRRNAVKRVIDIIMYLQARLRTDVGGAPAVGLADFYSAMFTMTLEASHNASEEEFRQVMACIRNVREAWVVVARDPEAQRLLPRELRSQEERYANTLPASATPSAAVSARWSA